MLNCSGINRDVRMDVLLIKDVETLGLKNEVVAVKRGYARNFLFPRGLAAYATEENKLKYIPNYVTPPKLRRKVDKFAAEEQQTNQKVDPVVSERKYMEDIKRQLQGTTLKFTRLQTNAVLDKEAKNPVTAMQIYTKLMKNNRILNFLLPSQIQLPALLNEYGEHKVKIVLGDSLNAFFVTGVPALTPDSTINTATITVHLTRTKFNDPDKLPLALQGKLKGEHSLSKRKRIKATKSNVTEDKTGEGRTEKPKSVEKNASTATAPAPAEKVEAKDSTAVAAPDTTDAGKQKGKKKEQAKVSPMSAHEKKMVAEAEAAETKKK